MKQAGKMAAHHCTWSLPPVDLTLPQKDVHIWQASLVQPAEQIAMLAQTLTADEQQRATRFHFEADRERFIVGRGVLRAILGRYLGLEPGQVRFSYSPHGKPAVQDNPGAGAVRFNLAHAGEIALYAVAHTEVGVDLEAIVPVPGSEQIAERYFTLRERTVLHALSKREWETAFLRQWTRKEAYLKARGCGLSLEPDQVEVLLDSNGSLKLNVAGEPDEAARWSLSDLTPAEGYVAALAVEGQGWHLHCFRWES